MVQRLLFVLCGLLFCAPLANAQPDSTLTEPDTVYTTAFPMPQLVGGMEMIHYNVRYSEEALEANAKGRVLVQVVVDPTGAVVEATTIGKKADYGFDEEALRVARNARFTPGRVDGEPVFVQTVLPIFFDAEQGKRIQAARAEAEQGGTSGAGNVQVPTLIGGMEALQEQLVIPEAAREASVSGQMRFEVRVDTSGRVTDITPLHAPLGYGMEEAAMDAIRSTAFAPARKDGEAVRARLILPVDVLPPPPAAEDGMSSEDVYVMVENMPELYGGLAGIQGRVRYPREARKNNVQGRVVVRFIVNTEGKVVDLSTVGPRLGYGLEEEAMRAVQAARFKPGVQDGETVPVQMSLPITFKLPK